MNFKEEKISPSTATKYLKKNMVNRNLSDSRVNAYASDMRNGNWKLNAEGIKFNAKGELVDGQHRLNAVIKSGKTVAFLVVRGIDDDVSIFDRGRNRSEFDSLQIEGMSKEVANSQTVAIAKLHFTLQTKGRNIPLCFIREFIKAHEESLEKVCSLSYRSHHGIGVSTAAASILLAYFYAFESGVSFEKLQRFNEIVKTGMYDQGKHESSAIIFRNDILYKNIDPNHNTTTRERTVYVAEKAIYDFDRGYDRKETYKNSGTSIYSKNPQFTVDKSVYC